MRLPRVLFSLALAALAPPVPAQEKNLWNGKDLTGWKQVGPGQFVIENGLLKTTSIASVISMEEVLRRGQILMQQKFQVLEVFMVVAIIYLAMTTCWDLVQRRIEAYYGKAYGAAADRQLARDDH